MNIGCIHPNKSVKTILPIILYSLLLVRFILEEFTELFPHFSCCFIEYMQTHTLDANAAKIGDINPIKIVVLLPKKTCYYLS